MNKKLIEIYKQIFYILEIDLNYLANNLNNEQNIQLNL